LAISRAHLPFTTGQAEHPRGLSFVVSFSVLSFVSRAVR